MNLESIHMFDIMRVGELFEEIKIQNLTYSYSQEAGKESVSKYYRIKTN